MLSISLEKVRAQHAETWRSKWAGRKGVLDLNMHEQAGGGVGGGLEEIIMAKLVWGSDDNPSGQQRMSDSHSMDSCCTYFLLHAGS